MNNRQTSTAVLERLAEVGPDGIEARFLREEFGGPARRCIVQLGFRQYIEAAYLPELTDGMDRSRLPAPTELSWSSPNPLTFREATKGLSLDGIRLRLSPFGQFVLCRKQLRSLDDLDGPEPTQPQVYLHDLLLAIHSGAHKLMSIVDPLVNEAQYPRHRLQKMKLVRDDLEDKWRSAVTTFNASVTAHVHHSLTGLSNKDMDDLATVVKHLDRLLRMNPRRPSETDLLLLDQVEHLAAALPLRLHQLDPNADSSRRRRSGRKVPGNLTALIQAALEENLEVSQDTLAERFGVSTGTINANSAWKEGIKERKRRLKDKSRLKLTEEQRIRDEIRKHTASDEDDVEPD